MILENIYIGFDRDGTLEMPGHEMPDQLVMQMKTLQEAGAKLFIASGKDHLLLSNIFNGVNLDFWMICAENGGHIVIPENEIDMIYSPQEEHLKIFLDNLENLDLPPYREEPKKSIWSKKFGAHSLAAKKIIDQFILENSLALKVYAYPDGDGGLDVVPDGIDKINLIPFIPNNAVIHYFGDGENDLSLMSHQKIIPHTVANAHFSVKECVSSKSGYQASANAGEGVSEIITRLFNI